MINLNYVFFAATPSSPAMGNVKYFEEKTKNKKTQKNPEWSALSVTCIFFPVCIQNSLSSGKDYEAPCLHNIKINIGVKKRVQAILMQGKHGKFDKRVGERYEVCPMIDGWKLSNS